MNVLQEHNEKINFSFWLQLEYQNSSKRSNVWYKRTPYQNCEVISHSRLFVGKRGIKTFTSRKLYALHIRTLPLFWKTYSKHLKKIFLIIFSSSISWSGTIFAQRDFRCFLSWFKFSIKNCQKKLFVNSCLLFYDDVEY